MQQRQWGALPRGALGPYAGRFLRVLQAAEEENPRLTVRVEAE